MTTDNSRYPEWTGFKITMQQKNAIQSLIETFAKNYHKAALYYGEIQASDKMKERKDSEILTNKILETIGRQDESPN